MAQWNSPEASSFWTPISMWEGQGGVGGVHRNIIPGSAVTLRKLPRPRPAGCCLAPLSDEWPILPCSGVPADHKLHEGRDVLLGFLFYFYVPNVVFECNRQAKNICGIYKSCQLPTHSAFPNPLLACRTEEITHSSVFPEDLIQTSVREKACVLCSFGA